MPLFTVENLKQRLQGGAKKDKFTLLIDNPAGAPEVGLNNDDYCLIQGFNFPERSLGKIDAWVQGRKLIIPGDTEYTNTWNLTLYNTPNHDIRQKLITWMAKMDSYTANWHTTDPWSLVSKAKLIQMDGVGNALKEYTLHNIFPSNIGEVSVNASEINSIQTFSVTFTFSHMSDD